MIKALSLRSVLSRKFLNQQRRQIQVVSQSGRYVVVSNLQKDIQVFEINADSIAQKQITIQNQIYISDDYKNAHQFNERNSDKIYVYLIENNKQNVAKITIPIPFNNNDSPVVQYFSYPQTSYDIALHPTQNSLVALMFNSLYIIEQGKTINNVFTVSTAFFETITFRNWKLIAVQDQGIANFYVFVEVSYENSQLASDYEEIRVKRIKQNNYAVTYTHVGEFKSDPQDVIMTVKIDYDETNKILGMSTLKDEETVKNIYISTSSVSQLSVSSPTQLNFYFQLFSIQGSKMFMVKQEIDEKTLQKLYFSCYYDYEVTESQIIVSNFKQYRLDINWQLDNYKALQLYVQLQGKKEIMVWNQYKIDKITSTSQDQVQSQLYYPNQYFENPFIYLRTTSLNYPNHFINVSQTQLTLNRIQVSEVMSYGLIGGLIGLGGVLVFIIIILIHFIRKRYKEQDSQEQLSPEQRIQKIRRRNIRMYDRQLHKDSQVAIKKEEDEKSINFEERQCCICLDENCDFMSQCKHFFHEKCLYEWRQHSSDKCPICRKRINLDRMRNKKKKKKKRND